MAGRRALAVVPFGRGNVRVVHEREHAARARDRNDDATIFSDALVEIHLWARS